MSKRMFQVQFDCGNAAGKFVTTASTPELGFARIVDIYSNNECNQLWLRDLHGRVLAYNLVLSLGHHVQLNAPIEPDLLHYWQLTGQNPAAVALYVILTLETGEDCNG